MFTRICFRSSKKTKSPKRPLICLSFLCLWRGWFLYEDLFGWVILKVFCKHCIFGQLILDQNTPRYFPIVSGQKRRWFETGPNGAPLPKWRSSHWGSSVCSLAAAKAQMLFRPKCTWQVGKANDSNDRSLALLPLLLVAFPGLFFKRCPC